MNVQSLPCNFSQSRGWPSLLLVPTPVHTVSRLHHIDHPHIQYHSYKIINRYYREGNKRKDLHQAQIKNLWHIFSNSSWWPHNLEVRKAGSSLSALWPSTQPLCFSRISLASWVFFPPSCREVQEKLVDTSIQHEGLPFTTAHSLSLRNEPTLSNSFARGCCHLRGPCLHGLIWCEQQRLSQTRASQWPLARQGRKILPEGTSTLWMNQSGRIRSSLRKLGCKSLSQPAAEVEAAGVAASKQRNITRSSREQKPGSLEGKRKQKSWGEEQETGKAAVGSSSWSMEGERWPHKTWQGAWEWKGHHFPHTTSVIGCRLNILCLLTSLWMHTTNPCCLGYSEAFSDPYNLQQWVRGPALCNSACLYQSTPRLPLPLSFGAGTCLTQSHNLMFTASSTEPTLRIWFPSSPALYIMPMTLA